MATICQVRWTNGLISLQYRPMPVTWDRGSPTGYVGGRPVMPRNAVVSFAWAFVPQTLLNQLESIPTDQEVDVLLPIPSTGAGTALRWGWVRGWLVKPPEMSDRNRRDWSGATWKLTNAREV